MDAFTLDVKFNDFYVESLRYKFYKIKTLEPLIGILLYCRTTLSERKSPELALHVNLVEWTGLSLTHDMKGVFGNAISGL